MKQEKQKPGQGNPAETYDPSARNFQRPDTDNSAINDVAARNSNDDEAEDINDTDPDLTEEDLDENDLDVEDADAVEWDEPEPGGEEDQV